MKTLSLWFLAVRAARLQIDSKVYQCALRKPKFFAYKMHDSTNLDEPLPPKSFFRYRKVEAAHFSDKLKPLRHSTFTNTIMPAEVTFYLLTQDGKTIHTQRNHLIPYHPKEQVLFPHLQLRSE